MISGYNSQAPPVKNLMKIIEREIRISGFLVFSLLPKYAEEFYGEVPRRIANGEFRYLEDTKKGLRYAGDAIYEVQAGKNHGKSVIQVAEA